MKHYYLFISLFFLSASTFAQGYEFGLVQNSTYNYSLVATPDFASSGNTAISDIGFGILLPAGDFEVDMATITPFFGRSWTTNANATGPALMGPPFNVGDGTKDLVIFNLNNSSTTMLAHSANQVITLVTFDITNSPGSGAIELLANTDAIAVVLNPAANSFYNSNAQPGDTIFPDYFSGIYSGSQMSSGTQSHNFGTLGINDIAFEDAQISIYPNPTIDRININTNKSISYSIYNILGQSVKLAGELNAGTQKSISLSHLPDGIYILKAQDDNKNTKSFKIIKKE